MMTISFSTGPCRTLDWPFYIQQGMLTVRVTHRVLRRLNCLAFDDGLLVLTGPHITDTISGMSMIFPLMRMIGPWWIWLQ